MIVCEIPDALWDCPRAAAFERFADWLAEHQAAALGLPDREVVVELCAGDVVPKAFGAAVGVFVVEERRAGMRGFHDELRVVVAVGEDSTDWDWQARLETLPHELAHAGDFWQQFELTPEHVARAGRILEWHTSAEREAQVEWLGGTLTRKFLDEVTELAVAPQANPGVPG